MMCHIARNSGSYEFAFRVQASLDGSRPFVFLKIECTKAEGKLRVSLRPCVAHGHLPFSGPYYHLIITQKIGTE